MSTSHAVAIIGMGCRFPGASSLEQFWTNLVDGVESITFFGPIQRSDAGHEVHAAGLLDDVAAFDAALFGLSAREAERMDPQHRVLLECAWEAVERAGHNPRKLPGRTGVFAGTGFNDYLIRNIAPSASDGDLSLLLTNDCSFLPTRLAYVLGCTGPAISVSSACSTSLVAVHMAVQSLLADECDTAIAGGVRITTPQRRPYRHEPGGIGSSDGHCRAFDRNADGTVGGNGAGVVVLRRLEDALTDGDPIAAVILGSAVTNDGARRVGFTAPGIDGQRSAILEAQVLADVSPDTIGMIEAHGTGTTLGDPVEFEALTAAFRQGTTQRNFCALGSVKTNIGHLDAAAGIAGLIKTVLAIQHRIIPPSLHFREPNPRIDLEASPFFVNVTARPWLDVARRAGVSSFGMGGTNAHLVLESAPEQQLDDDQIDGTHRLVLSARSEPGLRQLAEALADYIEREQPPLVDVAYTLAVSRSSFTWQMSFECTSLAEAVDVLRSNPPMRQLSSAPSVEAKPGRRLALPPTPFERQRYWIDAPSPLARRAEPADWLYAPRLRQSAPLGRTPIDTRRIWLVLLDRRGVGPRIATMLRGAGAPVIEIDSADAIETNAIPTLMAADTQSPVSIISLWSLGTEDSGSDIELLRRHYFEPVHLLRTLGDRSISDVDVTFVADGVFDGFGTPAVPEKAMLLGLARALQTEYPGWRARVVDVEADSADSVERIVAEATARADDDAVIHRHGSRWVETVEPVKAAVAEAIPFRRGGVYLITGGNSGIGLAIGRHLCEAWGARVVAVSRRGAISVPGLTAVAADISDIDELRRVVSWIRAEYGAINGVVHCAGMPPHALLRTATDAAMHGVFAGKLLGARNLQRVLHGEPLDFVILCSSLRGHVPAAGASDYMAANLALEALAVSWAAAGTRVHSVAWDTWSDVGMAALASDDRFVPEDLRAEGLRTDDGLKVFNMAPACGLPRIVVSTRPLLALKERAKEAFSVARVAEVRGPATLTRHPRPALATPYVPTRTALEAQLAAIWSEVLGYEPIGVTDDFFDLGGDSVATLQVVARASEQGLNLETRRAFEAHTIEELVSSVSVELPGEEIPRGTPLPLSPTQQWLFGCGVGDVNRFVQGVVITLPADIDTAAVSSAIDASVAHHGALAVHFVQTDTGWKQVINPAMPVAVAIHQHPGPRARQLADAIEIGRALQSTMDVRTPPLLRAAIVVGPTESLLILAVHHLLIDASGWRILADDIQARVASLRSTSNVTESGATRDSSATDAAFLRWAISLSEVAEAGQLEEDAAFWSSLNPSPLDTASNLFSATQRHGPIQSLTSVLSTSDTTALTAGHRPIEALLAVAVARAIRSAVSSDSIPIDIESLGRGWSRVPQNVSRAIGWFTAIHPLVVDTVGEIETAAANAAALLPEARRRAVAYTVLRQYAPDRLPKALRSDAPVSIVFFPAETAASIWPVASILPAPEGMPTPHAVVLAASIDNGALHLKWHGQPEPLEGLVLDEIISRTMAGLRELAASGKSRVDTILAQLDLPEEVDE